MHVTIDPRPVQPVNHCFTTCTGRTNRVKPFTGRIRSTVLDKDAATQASVSKVRSTPNFLPLYYATISTKSQINRKFFCSGDEGVGLVDRFTSDVTVLFSKKKKKLIDNLIDNHPLRKNHQRT